MLQRPEVCIYLYFVDSLVSLTFQVLACLCSDNCYFSFSHSIDSSDRAFYKDLFKVIEASDVLLEVLDAWNPLRTRCPEIENMVMKSGPNKRLVLVLNKIGSLLITFYFCLLSPFWYIYFCTA